jgi:hypothetical protein
MRVLLAVIGCFLVLVILRHVLPPYLIHFVRTRSTLILKDRFHTDVEFGQFDISLLFPSLVVTGSDVSLTRRETTSDALITVRKFVIETDLLRFAETPSRIRRVQLQGMVIHIPPRSGRATWHPETKRHYPVIVDNLECRECELDIQPKQANKEPLRFVIHQLTMQDAGLGRAAPYEATLTNAVPKGEIITSGQFGAWQPDEPGLTPLSGKYQFIHADLDPFRGIAGKLDSTGTFEGVLERIVADGKTTTPDFSLDVTGHRLALNTQFHAIIDGTTGDTALDPVTAQFGHSSLVARGGVFGLPGTKGKAVLLDVNLDPARLEDVLYLAVKGDTPPMTGRIRLRTKLAIPPGERTVSDRLKLDGRFLATSAEPTSLTMQDKLKRLSRRAEGKPKDEEAGSAIFDLTGDFVLDNGIAKFSQLRFSIPGANLDLRGNYGLHSEALDFRGKLRLQAKVSQTMTGIKSFFLKAVDPFLKGKDGGTILPIKITGTRERPAYGLAFHERGKKGRAGEEHASNNYREPASRNN